MWLLATVLDSTTPYSSQIIKSESFYSRTSKQFITKYCNLLSQVMSKPPLWNIRLGALDSFFPPPRSRVLRTFLEVGKTRGKGK